MKSILFLAICALLSLNGCNGYSVRGSGITKDETRDLGTFNSVDVSGAYMVKIAGSGRQKVQIIGDDNIIPLVSTRVENGTLKIFTQNNVKLNSKVEVRISTPELQYIVTSGANDIWLKNFTGERLDVEASGAGNIKLEGNTRWLNLDLSGAVKVYASNLNAENVRVDISGASVADVYSSEILDASISGVGSITYSGAPKEIKKDISGIGTIRQK
ncbi:MAG: head GIN domain-containing protein [Bacteroidota bacterium]